MLAEACLPQLNVTQTMAHEMERQSESISTLENSNSYTPIKIPLVSNQPILATSPNYFLVNESTRRRKQFVIYDDQLQRSNIRYFIEDDIVDALWYEKQNCFLILTSKRIYTLDPISKQYCLLEDIAPSENQEFKCFALLNATKLLIIYNQWNPQDLEEWEEDNDGKWKLTQRKPLKLTMNEFIGNMIVFTKNDRTCIGITIYNNLTEEWRLELRNADTLTCDKKVLLHETNMAHDCRVIFIENVQSKIEFLIFSNGSSYINAINDQWDSVEVNYKHSPQRMALFNGNVLIVRTTEKIDIHFFV